MFREKMLSDWNQRNPNPYQPPMQGGGLIQVPLIHRVRTSFSWVTFAINFCFVCHVYQRDWQIYQSGLPSIVVSILLGNIAGLGEPGRGGLEGCDVLMMVRMGFVDGHGVDMVSIFSMVVCGNRVIKVVRVRVMLSMIVMMYHDVGYDGDRDGDDERDSDGAAGGDGDGDE